MDDAEVVAVFVAELVRRVQAVADLGDEPAHHGREAGEVQSSRAAPDRAAELPEVSAHQELHHQERHALVLALVEHRADVRMPDQRRQPRLVEEHVDEAPILEHVRQHQLDRHERNLGLGIGRDPDVDRRHSAARDAAREPVAAQDVARTGAVRHVESVERRQHGWGPSCQATAVAAAA